MSETRTVTLTIDPALRAYLLHLDATEGEYSHAGYDLFSAGYRARLAEAAPAPAAEGGEAGD